MRPAECHSCGPISILPPARCVSRTSTGSRKFPPNHPIVTGDMVPTPGSTNVYEFGYDAPNHYLYVRFKLHGAPGEGVRPSTDELTYIR